MNTPSALDREREQIRAQCAAAGPWRVLSALGLHHGARREGSGYKARCPWCNGGRDTPPLSVRVREGQVFAKCFSCDAAGDIFALVAAVHGHDTRRDFAAIRAAAASIAGLAATLPAPTGNAPRAATEGPVTYPDAGEVQAVWGQAQRVADAPDAAAYLEARAIDAGAADTYDLARVLPPAGPLPPWARIAGRTWREAGYRLVVPVFDHHGAMRSLRAWRLPGGIEGGPKRIAPAGCSSAGLVMACPVARHMLSTGAGPEGLAVVIAEGEPDWLTWASRVSDAAEAPAILGIGAGAWCEALAARIPDGARVAIRTHQDTAGNRYAADIRATLAERARAQRLTIHDLARP